MSLRVKNYDCRHEVWQWDGITAQSLIFANQILREPVEENILSICEKHIGEEYDEY